MICFRRGTMIQLENLAETAEELRRSGVAACHEILYGPHGGREGLDVGDDFFPLWELLLPENQEALARLDFAAIRDRRSPDWSVDPPRYANVTL
jgi:hypothetical protein